MAVKRKRPGFKAAKGARKAKKKSPPLGPLVKPGVARRLLEALTGGVTLNTACRLKGMPSPGTIIDWCRKDADFAERYTQAREIGYMVMADELTDMAAAPTTDYHRQRLMVDTRKWLVTKVLPKIYGDRLQLHGDPNAPLMVKTDTELAHEIRALLAVAAKRMAADSSSRSGKGPGDRVSGKSSNGRNGR